MYYTSLYNLCISNSKTKNFLVCICIIAFGVFQEEFVVLCLKCLFEMLQVNCVCSADPFLQSGKEGGIVKTLVVDLRGEGVSPGSGGRGRGDESGSNINYAHPDDMATSIRPYDGYQVV